jgi:hypothetical protein
MHPGSAWGDISPVSQNGSAKQLGVFHAVDASLIFFLPNDHYRFHFPFNYQVAITDKPVFSRQDRGSSAVHVFTLISVELRQTLGREP